MTKKYQQPAKLLLIAIFSILAVTLGTLSVQSLIAQQNLPSQTLEVSPPSQELNADPGQSINVKTKITNKSKDVANIKVRVNDITATGEDGQIALIEKDDKSLVNWTTLDIDTFSLKAGESKEVNATVNIPADVAGGHYGSVVFQLVNPNTPANETAIAQEVASLFLIRVSGPVNESTEILEFSAPNFSEFGPVPFKVRFRNNGNIHTKPVGLIAITDMFGNKVADMTFSGQNIFPGSTRIVNASFDQQWLFGQYTAEAILYSGSKNQSLTAKTVFIVVPVRIIGVGAVILIGLFLVRRRIIKAFKALTGSK